MSRNHPIAKERMGSICPSDFRRDHFNQLVAHPLEKYTQIRYK